MEVRREKKSIKGHNGYTIDMDFHYIDGLKMQAIALFVHGYKGFKDFAAWSLIADEMAKNGIVFVRFNFSHNGTSSENPSDFTRLDLFAENNFSIEQEELKVVINEVYTLAASNENWNENKITLIGHSRGGGMAILASLNPKVHALITWAAIKDVFDMTPSGEALEEWKMNGVRYVLNGRTKQKMPHNYQFYLDTIKNKNKLDIQASAKKLNKPWLIIHGDNDEAVPLSYAKCLHEWNDFSELLVIKNGGHTFSTSHPWTKNYLPTEMQKVLDKSMTFILNS